VATVATPPRPRFARGNGCARRGEAADWRRAAGRRLSAFRWSAVGGAVAAAIGGDFVSERIDDASDGRHWQWRQGQWQEEKEWEWIRRQRLCMLLTMQETRFQSCIKVYNFDNGVKYRSASISECTSFDIGMSVVRYRSTLSNTLVDIVPDTKGLQYQSKKASITKYT
jgi:hypothetical protein